MNEPKRNPRRKSVWNVSCCVGIARSTFRDTCASEPDSGEVCRVRRVRRVRRATCPNVHGGKMPPEKKSAVGARVAAVNTRFGLHWKIEAWNVNYSQPIYSPANDALLPVAALTGACLRWSVRCIGTCNLLTKHCKVAVLHCTALYPSTRPLSSS